jgi:ABC-type transport system involved in multi-copper enzyme maturation permease subunit
MLRVDFRRMFRSKLFYILIASALVMPILMTVMMAMMDGSVSVDPQTGVETVMQGPENTWQNLGTLPSPETLGGSDIFAMCNINMMFMAVAVFICLFISDDFRSGYAKNLFTVRAKKGDYVVSKTLSGFVCGAFMLMAYFLGSVLGGAIAGLSFYLYGLDAGHLVMCMLAKILLMLVFVSIFVLISVAAKQKAWLAICGSLGGGMLLFMMVSMITPLNSTAIHVVLCLAGGAMFAFGLGAISRVVLKKSSLV